MPPPQHDILVLGVEAKLGGKEGVCLSLCLNLRLFKAFLSPNPSQNGQGCPWCPEPPVSLSMEPQSCIGFGRSVQHWFSQRKTTCVQPKTNLWSPKPICTSQIFCSVQSQCRQAQKILEEPTETESQSKGKQQNPTYPAEQWREERRS